jgi:S-ribosylhomocysteine lyase
MEKIASFTINHDTLEVGMYLSRVEGDIVTYDLRMVKPNNGYFLSTGSIHTVEHLMATYLRNTPEKGHIIYAGPMGCRTGCYLLTKDLSHETVIRLVQETFAFIQKFQGEIPGSRKEECGNYLDHDLEAAKKDTIEFFHVIQNYTPDRLKYPD